MKSELPGRAWHLAVDTARPTPEDMAAPDEQPPVAGDRIRLAGRSVVVLEGR